MRNAYILLFLVANQVFALGEKELKTEKKQVTVFLEGAQIIRSGSTTIQPGRYS